MLTHGFEFEVASGADEVINELYERGEEVMRTEELHSYHCGCSDCAVWPRTGYDGNDQPYAIPPPMFHAQRDSSCGGEFITKVLDDFEDTRWASQVLMDALRAANASVNNNCGLHVHVSAAGLSKVGGEYRWGSSGNVPLAYLLVERYIAELIAPGATRNKRDMNRTLLQALRDYLGSDRAWAENCSESWASVNSTLQSAIDADRHVDLNISGNNNTYEFRVFNATTHAWRINLACRLSVAFVERHQDIIAACTENMESSDLVTIIMGRRWPTMRPRISMGRFIDILSQDDEELRRLMLRQCLFVRQQYRPEFDLDAIDTERDEAERPAPERRPEPSINAIIRQARRASPPPVVPEDDTLEPSGAVINCNCEDCEQYRATYRERTEPRFTGGSDPELEQLLNEVPGELPHAIIEIDGRIITYTPAGGGEPPWTF